MTRWMMALLAWMLLGALVARGQQPQIPETASPSFATIVKVDRSAGVLTYHSMMMEKFKQYGTYELDGKKVQGWYWDHVYAEREIRFSLKDGQAYDAEGTRLQDAEFWQRAAVGATILVAPDGQKVAPGYLRAIRKETLVLVPPAPKPTTAMPSPAELAPPDAARTANPRR